MQIKIEIDVKPDELRRFLGLPDVAGLQEDVVRFLRDKVSNAGDSFDPAAVMQGGLDLLKRTPAWRRIKDVIVPPNAGSDGEGEAIKIVVESAETAPRKSGRQRRSAPKKSARTTRKSGKSRRQA